MCIEGRANQLLPTLLYEAKKALGQPILFFQFVERVENLLNKLLFMLDEEKEAYQKCWWDMQEVHLTLLQPWSEVGESNSWNYLESYHQQVVCVIQKFILFCVEYYLKTIQLVINKAISFLRDFDSFFSFGIGLCTLTESLILLSEREQEVLLNICSDLEILALSFSEGRDVKFKNNQWCMTYSQIMDGYYKLVRFLQQHQIDIKNQYL